MRIKIANKRIGGKAPTFIIAEIGTNHNGDFKLAMRMIKEAAEVGADAVKLQIVESDASYLKGSASYDIFSRVSLTFEELKKLKAEARKRKIIFFATPGDIPSLKLLLRLKSSAIKISSGCMTNTPLLKEAARTGLPIIISTGMAYMKEVQTAISTLKESGAKDIVILHCVSSYPSRYEELNLKTLETLKREFKYPIGYSDHTKGALASFVAVLMGASVIEKHFTLDKRLKGPDHHFSADPAELRELVSGIRSIEKMAGTSVKRPNRVEMKTRDAIRRFLVFTRDLKKGVVIKEDDISAKRLIRGKGLAPEYYNRVIGRRLRSKVDKDQPVNMKWLYQRG